MRKRLPKPLRQWLHRYYGKNFSISTVGGIPENMNLLRVKAERSIGNTDLIRAVLEYVTSDEDRLSDCALFCADQVDELKCADQRHKERLGARAKKRLEEAIEQFISHQLEEQAAFSPLLCVLITLVILSVIVAIGIFVFKVPVLGMTLLS